MIVWARVVTKRSTYDDGTDEEEEEDEEEEKMKKNTKNKKEPVVSTKEGDERSFSDQLSSSAGSALMGGTEEHGIDFQPSYQNDELVVINLKRPHDSCATTSEPPRETEGTSSLRETSHSRKRIRSEQDIPSVASG
ncbi:hypothetical protein PSHT_07568 [Puccinia striiformis]|uniref:Uncharacterized protein n=1 Tax=Puccinia striiformis TaxID=27350 RepID=A0A2S4VWR5_9BASI|nr:hypothetical protein PSHT_07568 [Puccinia striiformis]